MKNFSKEQSAVFIVSLLAIIVLLLQVTSIDSSTSADDLKTRYKSSVDSVQITEKLVSYLSEENFSYSKDVLNFKVSEIKARKVEDVTEDTAPVVQTRWVNTSDIDLFGKDVIAYTFFFNGKARFTINGKTQEVNVGDELKIGKIIQREVVVGSNAPTGRTRTSGDYSGKVLSIGERSVYVDTGIKANVVRFRQGLDAVFFSRNLMQDPAEEDKESTGTDAGGDTPGRRPGRGGR